MQELLCVVHLFNETAFPYATGKCTNCSTITPYMTLKYCRACAGDLNCCYICGGTLNYSQERAQYALNKLRDLYQQQKRYYTSRGKPSESSDKALTKIDILIGEVDTGIYTTNEELYKAYMKTEKITKLT